MGAEQDSARHSGEDPGAEVPTRDTDGAAAAHVVGVGPWDGPWPEGDHWDPELLKGGDR